MDILNSPDAFSLRSMLTILCTAGGGGGEIGVGDVGVVGFLAADSFLVTTVLLVSKVMTSVFPAESLGPPAPPPLMFALKFLLTVAAAAG